MSSLAVFVPKGWVALDLHGDRDAQIRGIVAARLRDAPAPRRGSLTTYLRRQLTDLTEQLADTGAILVAFPVVPLDGQVLQPQLVVAPWELPDDRDPMDILLAIASRDGTAQVLDTGELVALRTTTQREVTADAQAALEAVVGSDSAGVLDQSRLIGYEFRYFMGDPGRRDRWLTAVCTMTYLASDGSDELMQSMNNLFDELVAAIGWDQ